MKRRSITKSFAQALRGIAVTARTERNFRIQLVAGVLALLLAAYLPLLAFERVVILLLIGAVLVLEIINSTFERIADAVAPRLSFMVREVKDMMAGAVLLTAIVAVAVAVIIFVPYLVPRLWYTVTL